MMGAGGGLRVGCEWVRQLRSADTGAGAWVRLACHDAGDTAYDYGFVSAGPHNTQRWAEAVRKRRPALSLFSRWIETMNRHGPAARLDPNSRLALY